MFVSTGEKDFYDQIYPRGWCLIPEMETVHQDTWFQVVDTLRIRVDTNNI